MTFRQATRSPQFWLVGFMLFCLVFIGQIMVNHLSPHSQDIGISPTVAASFVSMYAATSLIGRNLCGVFSDRFGSRKTMLIGFVMVTMGMVWLVFATQVWMLYLFSLWYGISFGIVVPLQSLMPGELFGLKSLGIITAALMLMGNIGGAVSSPLAGAIFDATGKYDIAFYSCTGAALLGMILAWFLLRGNWSQYRQ
jgi:MFS family permease